MSCLLLILSQTSLNIVVVVVCVVVSHVFCCLIIINLFGLCFSCVDCLLFVFDKGCLLFGQCVLGTFVCSVVSLIVPMI